MNRPCPPPSVGWLCLPTELRHGVGEGRDELEAGESSPHRRQRLGKPPCLDSRPVKEDDAGRRRQRPASLRLVEDAAPAGQVCDRAEDGHLVARHLRDLHSVAVMARNKSPGVEVVFQSLRSGGAQTGVHRIAHDFVESLVEGQPRRVKKDASLHPLQPLVVH